VRTPGLVSATFCFVTQLAAVTPLLGGGAEVFFFSGEHDTSASAAMATQATETRASDRIAIPGRGFGFLIVRQPGTGTYPSVRGVDLVGVPAEELGDVLDEHFVDQCGLLDPGLGP
jgi:hypothetical protein